VSEPTTIRDLYPVLGELLDLLAEEVPEAVSVRCTWSIGTMPALPRGIQVGVLDDDASGSVLTRIADLLGGESTVRRSHSPYEVPSGMRRLYDLHAHYQGIPVRITVTRPEPTEREALLARLAELDAAEGGERP
jgi:hypothetical protein